LKRRERARDRPRATLPTFRPRAQYFDVTARVRFSTPSFLFAVEAISKIQPLARSRGDAQRFFFKKKEKRAPDVKKKNIFFTVSVSCKDFFFS